MYAIRCVERPPEEFLVSRVVLKRDILGIVKGIYNKWWWDVGICERTKAKSPFPLDCVYAIPCGDRPPEEFLIRSMYG